MLVLVVGVLYFFTSKGERGAGKGPRRGAKEERGWWYEGEGDDEEREGADVEGLGVGIEGPKSISRLFLELLYWHGCWHLLGSESSETKECEDDNKSVFEVDDDDVDVVVVEVVLRPVCEGASE
jgi:hypothetical protein